MEIVPWRPLRELRSVRKEVERLWNELFDETPFAKRCAEEWTPSVDISETEKDFIIEAELPGVELKDINVTISADRLTLKGEKKREEEGKGELYYRTERYYGAFQRVFQLPTQVQDDKIEATFDKGILKITVPKGEEAKKKRIKIQVH